MQYDKPVSRRMSGKVPSLDLRATDSGTIAKSRDGSTAPSEALDGACSRQVGERTGVSSPVAHKSAALSHVGSTRQPLFGTATRALNYRLSLIAGSHPAALCFKVECSQVKH